MGDGIYPLSDLIERTIFCNVLDYDIRELVAILLEEVFEILSLGGRTNGPDNLITSFEISGYDLCGNKPVGALILNWSVRPRTINDHISAAFYESTRTGDENSGGRCNGRHDSVQARKGEDS